MPFLRRRRRSSSGASSSAARRRKRVPTFRSQLDWSLHPDTAREVLGIALTVIGVLFLISIFHLAGRFGQIVLDAATNLWGILGYIAPLAFLIMGIKLLMPREEGKEIKASVIIGVILAFITVPGLFLGAGGTIGHFSFHAIASLLGNVGGYIVLLGLSLAALIIATNI